MNKAQIEFLLENGFKESKSKKKYELQKYLKVSSFTFMLVTYCEMLGMTFEVKSEVLNLKELKASRKEIEQFEKLCIKLEGLGNETKIK